MTRKEPPAKPKHKTREAWLQKAVDLLRPVFHRVDYVVPGNIRVSVGFPYGGKNKRSGECWAATCSADKVHEIFVSPKTADPMVVLTILTHELIHPTVGLKAGHKKPFKQCAAAVGLEGKVTGDRPGEELTVVLFKIMGTLGPYPHGALTPKVQEKQTTRLLKLECRDCGCTIRTTQKWLDEYPQDWPCPCGGVYFQEVKGE